jgi:hypothetical protein
LAGTPFNAAELRVSRPGFDDTNRFLKFVQYCLEVGREVASQKIPQKAFHENKFNTFHVLKSEETNEVPNYPEVGNKELRHLPNISRHYNEVAFFNKFPQIAFSSCFKPT